jgi:hypothetical protein
LRQRRNGLDVDQAEPRTGDADQQKQEANRIYPGEFAIRIAVGCGQAQPRQIVLQLVHWIHVVCILVVHQFQNV